MVDDVIQVHMNDKTYPTMEVVDYEGNKIETDDDQAMLKLEMLMNDVEYKITSKVSDLAGITLREFRDAAPFGWNGIKTINGLVVRSCVLCDRKHCIILCDKEGFATRFDEARRVSKWKRLEDHEKLYRVEAQEYEG
jgi:hypothetical protein